MNCKSRNKKPFESSDNINFKDKLSSFLEHAKDTVSGAVGKSTASDINMAANLYNLGQGGRDTTANYYLSEYEAGRKEAQRALEQMIEDGASARDIADQKAIVDDFQRKYNAMSAAGDAQRGATKAAYGLADDVKSSGEADIARAKDGADALGRFAVDVGVNGIQTGLDAVKSAALLGGCSVLPLAGRKYGEHTQTARQAVRMLGVRHYTARLPQDRMRSSKNCLTGTMALMEKTR